MKMEPNQAMERTSASVTDRAPSSTLRASHTRRAVAQGGHEVRLRDIYV